MSDSGARVKARAYSADKTLVITSIPFNRNTKRSRLFSWAAALALLAVSTTWAVNGELGFSCGVTATLTQSYAAKFGESARARLRSWQTVISNVRAHKERGHDEQYVLGRVNDYFNFYPYLPDIVHWHTDDYWSTPAEFIGGPGGDCEDYAIAKYFALKELGVPVERLRIAYVLASMRDRTQQAHMVLAYYPKPDATPLILDDAVSGRILPATERPDLIPVYTFNDEDILFRYANASARERPADARQWKELMQRLETELRS